MKTYTDAQGKTYLAPETAADVSDEMLSIAESVYDGFFAREDRIDWEEFIDRLSKYGVVSDPAFDFEDYDNGAVRKIQRHIRKYRSEG